MAYNEPYVDYYRCPPAYRDYPVVGVNWLSATITVRWRTDRGERTDLIREGLFEHYPNQINEDHFTTDAYWASQYEERKARGRHRGHQSQRITRNVRMEDGI
jgi:hypothetical protein